MASPYPAQFLGLEHELGRIAPGYRANLVLADDGLNVMDTWIDGRTPEDDRDALQQYLSPHRRQGRHPASASAPAAHFAASSSWAGEPPAG